MAYAASEGRQQLLDMLAEAVDELGYGLASLAAAYEQLDQATADRLEDELFGPLQRAYGRAKRAHADFAGRHGLETRAFEQQSAGVPSTGAKGFLDNALAAVEAGAAGIAAVQDSPLLLEVGDRELRGALAAVREPLADLTRSGRDLVRRLGR